MRVTFVIRIMKRTNASPEDEIIYVTSTTSYIGSRMIDLITQGTRTDNAFSIESKLDNLYSAYDELNAEISRLEAYQAARRGIDPASLLAQRILGEPIPYDHDLFSDLRGGDFDAA